MIPEFEWDAQKAAENLKNHGVASEEALTVFAADPLANIFDDPDHSAAREIARVLRPGGRFVAAVWAGPESCDIVLFQQTGGSFAPPPPVPGVGPGAVADPRPFLAQLVAVGIEATVETEVLGFEFDGFESAWNTLAGVTTAQLAPERREEAKAAVRRLMWPDGDGRRHFRNTTQFVVGTKRQGA